jgi:hypothetical protein
MKGSILRVCLIILLLLAGAGIPAAASPSISSISPTTGPNNGDVLVTISGTGFNSQSTVWMSSCNTGEIIYGTIQDVNVHSITCRFSFNGQTPDLYNVGVNSPFYDPFGNYYPEDSTSLSRSFEIYQGTGTRFTIVPGIVMTTSGPIGPYGTIYIETSPPGADISVDGENKGHAPVTITGLWPGTYTISARLVGYQEYISETTLSGSQYSPVYCRLVSDNSGNGLYVVSTPAKANVYVDGILAGVTPFMQSNIVTGTHIIQVRLSGYDEWKSIVEVPKNGSKTVSALLNKTDTIVTRGIHVASIPDGAAIALDGRARGVTPKTLNNIAAGIHVLEINYPGYNSWKSTIDVPETEIIDISVNLSQRMSPPGWITVSSGPGNASVTLDGSYIGRTMVNSSLNLDTITPGEHIIALELPGYQPFSTRINVSSHLVSSVNAVLVPASVTSAKGVLSVTSDPAGAMISMDNSSIGISPLTASDIAPGDHQVIITMEGYQNYSTSILIAAGNTTIVSATLLPVTPSLYTPLCPLSALGALGIIGFLLQRKPE